MTVRFEQTLQVIRQLFALSTDIRYVALYRSGLLTSRQRPELKASSASESDKYEELFVNPALLMLVHQRGDLDCGGARYVLIRYGNFYQLVLRLNDGHASICFEPDAHPLEFAKAITEVLNRPEGTA